MLRGAAVTDDLEAFAQRFAEIKARSRAEEGDAPITQLAPADLEAFMRERHPTDWQRLAWAWRGVHARPKQLAPPGEWLAWLFLAGRGSGKTRAGAEWCREREEKGARRIALVGPTRGEIKRVMVMGDSGIVAVCPPWNRPVWKENDGELHWPSGAIGYACTAEKPELRGGNYDSAWCDEPILWPYLEPLWFNLLLALRRRVHGMRPQACVTTTPRPIDWLRRLIMSPTTHTTHGASTENTAMPESWHAEMRDMLGGTRQGAQELEAEVLGDDPNALFTQARINANRVSEAPPLVRIVVSIDPSTSVHAKSDATGIVVLGEGVPDRKGGTGDIYILADGTAKLTPEAWGDRAFELLDAWSAHSFAVERNKIGDLAKSNLRAAAVRRRVTEPPIAEVLAMGDKGARALPVSTLYEKGRVHHVGVLPRLEAEMTTWDPSTGVSPNGLDALVHAVHLLARLGETPEPPKRDASESVRAWTRRQAAGLGRGAGGLGSRGAL